jgi:hypothetical protein
MRAMPAATPPAAPTLLVRYCTALGLYFTAMWLLWQIGIEAIYQHPTPFYALFRPVYEIYDLAPLFAYNALAFGVFTGFFGLLVWGAGKGGSWSGARGDRVRPARAEIWFLLGVIAFAFAFAAAIAMIRGGPHGIAQPYERPYLEYAHDIGTGGSIPGLFGDYARVHEHLTAHSRVHPPGPIAILWLFSYVVGRESLGLALASMAFGVLAIVPLYFWVRDMLGQRVAMTACVVYACVPSIVLFTATSADIAFTPFTIATLFLFWRAIDRPSIGYAILAGVGYAMMSLISFTLIGVGAFFGLEGLRRIIVHKAWRNVVQTAAVMLAAFLATHAFVRFSTGFDVIEVFRLAMESFQTDQHLLDEYAPRFSTWWWKIWNPACWFYFAGIPVSLLLIARLRRPEPSTKALFIVFGLTLLALDILYMARGEGERSAMYILPFAVIPAAHLLDGWGEAAQSLRPLLATVGFLAFQCWLTEVLFYTYW